MNYLQKTCPGGLGDSLTQDDGSCQTTVPPTPFIPGLPPPLPNPGAWSTSFVRCAKELRSQGYEHVANFQTSVPYTGAQGYYQKSVIYAEGITHDYSPAGHDLTTMAVRATVAAGNPSGSVWGLDVIAAVGLPDAPAADGHAQGIETSVMNYGGDQPDPDRPNSKYGLSVIAKGRVNSTCAIAARGTTNDLGQPTRWWRILFSTWADIVPGGKFIELLGRLFFDHEGRMTIYQQPEPMPPPSGAVTLWNSAGVLKAKRSDGSVLVIG